jgi:alkanesulfonate monooxygenase SsuD/methylene tetrahydromethanopterin reductase-like flavin-dependent oxidoreductase (luciferase family)
LWISDHVHPWNDRQGHSPFVWSTIGAIAQATGGMKLTTAVTCPAIRIHPGIIAQAAATSAVRLNGNLCLGLGSGEGGVQDHRGRHYGLEHCRVYEQDAFFEAYREQVLPRVR